MRTLIRLAGLSGWLILALGLGAQTPEVNRLAKLGEVWFKAKYFHPYLAYREMDWRAALSDAIPRAKTAATAQEFAAAVDHMLATLGDPATRVEGPPGNRDELSPANELLHWRKQDDGILVAGIHPVRVSPPNAQVRSEYGRLGREIAGARALVFDLRLPAQADRARSLFLSTSDRLISVLVSSSVTGPSRRRIVHHGLPRSDLIPVDYYSAFEVLSAAAYQPFPNTKDCPTVFLANRNSPWPPFAATMLFAGKASLVFEGEGTLNDSPAVMRIPLDSGWTAIIRLEEWVFPGGAGAPEPTVRVPEGQGMPKTLAVLRDGAIAPPKGTPVASAPIFRETSWSVSSDNPYPSAGYRLAAVFQLWGIVEYFFPHRSLIEADWNKILRQFIPRAEQARDALEYHLAVAEMCAFVGDSHLERPGSSLLRRHFTPIAGRSRYMETGGIAVRIVENTPVVWRVRSDKPGNVQPGAIIRQVDGEDAQARIGRLGKYISASTPQALRRDVATLLLAGPEGSEARIEVEDLQGGRRTVTLTRPGSRFDSLGPSPAPAPSRLVNDEIGYVDLSRVGAGELAGLIRQFQACKAIIFDIRQGASNTQPVLRSLLARRGGPGAIFRTPVLTGQALDNPGARRMYSVEGGGIIPAPANRPAYSGKVVLLMDEGAQSALEGMAHMFRALCDATLIGGPSTGANGDSTNFVLPGGLSVGLTGTDMKFVGPAGEIQQQRVGVQPDIPVEPTIRGIRAGRDEVLERAIEFSKTGK